MEYLITGFQLLYNPKKDVSGPGRSDYLRGSVYRRFFQQRNNNNPQPRFRITLLCPLLDQHYNGYAVINEMNDNRIFQCVGEIKEKAENQCR